ncbi:HNH endonuclease [Pseudoneobacillus sp. C159]
MVIFRKVSKFVNETVGEAAKAGVHAASKLVATKNEKLGEYLDDVGTTVVEASKATLDTVGQFTDGAVRGGIGLIKKDHYHLQRGWHDMKDSTGRTVKGMGSGILYTAKSAGITVRALRDNDREQLIHGLKNLGKVAAVTTFAIGIVDIIDGADIAEAEGIKTRNDHLAGFEHAETGVPFESKLIELPNGEVVEGAFPVFQSEFSVVLAEEVYLESDNTHFKMANETLYQSIEQDSNLARELGLSPTDVEALAHNQTPDGYVWHHSEQPGVLQLVEEEVHEKTGHTGGRELWGGGGENR